jgi:hypothetical protein
MDLVDDLPQRPALAEVAINGMESRGAASVIIGLGLDPKVAHKILLPHGEAGRLCAFQGAKFSRIRDQ